ncbi:UNVERIFIED_CONTAM: 30S ribosomal protein S1 [Sesamum angustifolium]|uniref:30S ribosomal protein S1 n=1 Tax=Sesamum angustifolium TaxID=2727405 RepID=A0AAW2PR74_9LAMI
MFPSLSTCPNRKGLKSEGDGCCPVIQADEENRKLIFSEKEAIWLKYSPQLSVGKIFEARVGSVEDYGAFVHLRFPDGLYHLTGLVHVSEVSWDLVQDVRDILVEGDEVRVKIVSIDREKSRITLSIKQLEEDPLLETLDKVIPQEMPLDSDALNASDHFDIEPLPGLDTIVEELLKEDGIDNVKISRQGFEKRVVSQDLQLWLSNAPPTGDQYTLLARAGRQACAVQHPPFLSSLSPFLLLLTEYKFMIQVQEIQLTTSLDQEGIKRALQRVLERVP